MVDAHINTEQLAMRASVAPNEVAAIDEGRPVVVPGALEFLTDLDRLATMLGLPSAEVVEETLSLWAEAYIRHGWRSVADRGQVDRRVNRPAGAGERSGSLRSAQWLFKAATTAPSVRRGLASKSLLLVLAALLAASGATLAGVNASGTNKVHAPSSRPDRSAGPAAVGRLLAPGASSSVGVGYTSTEAVLSLSFLVSRPSWVEVTGEKGPPLFAATVGPGTTGPITASVPFSVQIGAGGTTLVVAGGNRTEALTPPSAPFVFTVSSTAAR